MPVGLFRFRMVIQPAGPERNIVIICHGLAGGLSGLLTEWDVVLF